MVHFDLKCDNILLEPLETPRDPAVLPFRIVLSDFGESRMYQSASSALTVRYEGLGPLNYNAYTRMALSMETSLMERLCGLTSRIKVHASQRQRLYMWHGNEPALSKACRNWLGKYMQGVASIKDLLLLDSCKHDVGTGHHTPA